MLCVKLGLATLILIVAPEVFAQELPAFESSSVVLRYSRNIALGEDDARNIFDKSIEIIQSSNSIPRLQNGSGMQPRSISNTGERFLVGTCLFPLASQKPSRRSGAILLCANSLSDSTALSMQVQCIQ